MSNSINEASPLFRDTMLNLNIGKYDMIDQPMIYPIGMMSKLYGNLIKTSILPNGLLDYYNNISDFKKTGELEQTITVPSMKKRIDTPVEIEYPEKDTSKYSQLEGEQYEEKGKNNNWLSLTSDLVIGTLLGDSIGINYKQGDGVELVSSSLENSTSLAYRIGENIAGDSDLGKIGLNKLGLSFANSMLQKTRNESILSDWLKKPTEIYEAIDDLDFEKVKGLVLPNITKGLSNSILPIYMYSEVRKSDPQNFTWLNQGEYSHIERDGNLYTESINKVMIDENLNPLWVDTKTFSKESLLYKTQKLFENGKIQTLVSKLYSKDKDTNEIITKGGNLWLRDGKTPLESWTITNQYNKISSLKRPFSSNDKSILNNNLKRVRPNDDSVTLLSTYGVLQDDGFVKIAPYKLDKFGKNDIKKYMFSIENLAWKDSIDSIIEGTSQEGPNGGRIMWFPPYDITFNETTSVNLNSEVFIGRGEPVYTYSNTERNGTLNFKIIVDHPSIINYYKQDGFGIDGKKIEEEDYLRFFAGKDVIPLQIGNEKIEENIERENEKPTNQIKTAKFKVYFPNNYSGINDGYNTALKYLYSGTGCTITGGSGYENTIGLSEGMSSPCNGDYYYRVDSVQNVVGNQFKDLNCYGLNRIKQEGGDFYTFREAYEQIELSKTITESEEYLKKSAKKDYIYRYTEMIQLEINLEIKFNDYEIAVEKTENVTEALNAYNQAMQDYNTAYNNYIIAETENNRLNKDNNISFFVISNNQFNSNNELSDLNSKFEIYRNFQVSVINNLNEMLSSYKELSLTPTGDPSYNQILDNYTTSLSVYNYSKSTFDNYETELLGATDVYFLTVSTQIENSELYKILKDAKQISIMGSASKQGVASGNTILAKNRMDIIEAWLKTYNNSASYTKTNIYKEQGEVVSLTDKDTNSKTNKQDRFAYIEITTGGASINVEKSAAEIGYKPKETQQKDTQVTVKKQKKSMYGYYVDKNNVDDESLKLRNDESQFFEKIGNENDNEKEIIFSKLSEKIKHFSPAFHSTTPEGFNMRLTFLHQCTRQGPTLEAKNGATNMAFGRPPICVLRIGDFYNTKVIFENLNIDFEPLVWDLNEEGIGVQPMIANVSINFKFIGGSDLTGPIARLQNAITQNFFANTSVYDNRSDRIIKHEYTATPDDNNIKSDYKDTYDTLYNPFVFDK